MNEGVRKVNELVTQSGRTLIITDINIGATTVPDGTLLIDPASGKFKIKITGGTSWIDLTLANLIMQKSITGPYIADRSITGNNIALGAILGENIKDLEITTAKINNLAVIESKIADASITTPKIKDLNVTTEKIADSAIVTTKVTDGAITNPKIAIDSIDTLKVVDLAITENKIANAAITSAKLKDLCVGTNAIDNLAVTNAKIALGAITTDKIADNTIPSIKIIDGSITTSKLASGSVTWDKIANGAVDSNKLSFNSVLAAHIANNAVTNIKILDGEITISKFATALQNIINASIRVDPNNNNTAAVAGNLSVAGNITATGDISGARVYNAVYNDLAEAYIPEEKDIEPGDIVEVTETGTVRKAGNNSRATVGIASDCYATLFGGSSKEVATGEKIAVGLVGKVPVKIAGRAQIGDFVISIGNGIGAAVKTATPGCIVGKVIQNKFSDEIDKTLCLIFPS
jgi:hypothetical protein